MSDNKKFEYKTCDHCCYDILSDEGNVMEHECYEDGEDTDRDNKLIAEWMGLSHCSEGWITIPYHGREEVAEEEIVDELQYHTSWDWLMPVVEKCFETAVHEDDFFEISGSLPDRGKTYSAVVEFIKAQKQ